MSDTLTVTPSDGTAANLSPDNRIASVLPVERKTLKVAIVGMAPSSRTEAPFKDESWEIWSLSNCYQFIPRWDRWFELHDPYTRRDRYPTLWTWLTQQHGDKRIYLNQPCPDIPNGVVFPYEDIVREFNTRYFTNQISWMVAWAMHEGATEIGIYGVDMAQQMVGEQSEYAYQRPSCEYFLGMAVGRGIKLFVHPKSDVLKASCLYGVEGDQNQVRVKWKARLQEIQVKIDAHDSEHRDWSNKVWLYRGALDAMRGCSNFNKGKSIDVPAEWDREIAGLEQKVREAEAKREEALCKKFLFRGAQDDMNWWSEWIYTDWAGEGSCVCSICKEKLEAI